jgi:hypothetical protein
MLCTGWTKSWTIQNARYIHKDIYIYTHTYIHTSIRTYSFANRTIKLWNQLPALELTTFPWKSHIFRKRARKVIINEVKWRVFEGWWRTVQKWRDVKNREWSVVKCSEGKLSEVMILGEMCVLSLIYSYVAVCRFCVLRYLIIISFILLYSSYSTFVL